MAATPKSPNLALLSNHSSIANPELLMTHVRSLTDFHLGSFLQ